VQAAMQELALRRAARLSSATSRNVGRLKSQRAPFALAAAVGLAMFVGAVWHAVRPRHPGAGVVTAGTVLVNGTRADWVPDGSPVEVPGSSTARLRLADGSLLKLDPASRVVAQMPASQDRIVRLLTGGAEFDVKPQPREFRMETAIGRVRVRGTKFRVALFAASVLQVVVRQGTVSVECGHGATTLTGGQQRDFVMLPDGRGGPVLPGVIQSIDRLDRNIEMTGARKGPYRFGAVNVILGARSATVDSLSAGMTATLVLSPNEREVLEIRAQPLAHP
jgi:ferric-dicitrate binding protein FerR (iron transport regulator)